MQSLTPLTLAASICALLCCVRSIMIIRQLSWIPITVVVGLSLLLETTVAIPIQDFFPALVDFSVVAKNRAAISMLIFTAVLAVGQEMMLLAARRKQKHVLESGGYNADKLLFFAIAFWIVAMLGHFYFLFLKQNIEFLPTAINSFRDPDDHYGYRAYFSKIVYDAGRGQWV